MEYLHDIIVFAVGAVTGVGLKIAVDSRRRTATSVQQGNLVSGNMAGGDMTVTTRAPAKKKTAE